MASQPAAYTSVIAVKMTAIAISTASSTALASSSKPESYAVGLAAFGRSARSALLPPRFGNRTGALGAVREHIHVDALQPLQKLVE
jgi:hypothetical protein